MPRFYFQEPISTELDNKGFQGSSLKKEMMFSLDQIFSLSAQHNFYTQ
jgi:hypothetical protein